MNWAHFFAMDAADAASIAAFYAERLWTQCFISTNVTITFCCLLTLSPFARACTIIVFLLKMKVWGISVLTSMCRRSKTTKGSPKLPKQFLLFSTTSLLRTLQRDGIAGKWLYLHRLFSSHLWKFSRTWEVTSAYWAMILKIMFIFS